MRPNIIHSIVVCLAALTLPFMVACGSSQEEALPENVMGNATLYLNIEQIAQSRAGGKELTDNEKMHNVRVVILHADGTVEHNRYYALEGAQTQKFILLKVTPNEKKKVFIFSNEGSVTAVESMGSANGSLTAFFEKYPVNTPGFENAVNDIYFAPDYSNDNPIPMSSMYEVEVPAQGKVESTFYVVRVATKFTINFMNWRGEDVTVNDFTMASHADKNFLMAHVSDSERNSQLFKGKTWIDWLKGVSDASSENDDYAVTEAAGWLMDYELPLQADKSRIYTHGAITVGKATVTGNPATSTPGMAKTVFYLPESMNLKEGATDGEQEYTMTLNINGRTESFVSTLPNLKALFRNTHVVVNITMYHNLELSVDVIPFTSVELEPDYGLEREEYTGYIVGKDKAGNKCWYNQAENPTDPAKRTPYYLGRDDNASFVTINDKEYLLVYADFGTSTEEHYVPGYERTASNLHHIFEKDTRRKYLLTPEGITGYKFGDNRYINKLQQSVWLDSGGDPNGDSDAKDIYEKLGSVGLRLKCCRILYEWDRYDWDKARWWLLPKNYPKFWFDVLGNRYPWSEGNTEEKRKAKLGEWVKYLE